MMTTRNRFLTTKGRFFYHNKKIVAWSYLENYQNVKQKTVCFVNTIKNRFLVISRILSTFRANVPFCNHYKKIVSQVITMRNQYIFISISKMEKKDVRTLVVRG